MNAPRLIAGRFSIDNPTRDLLGQGGMGSVYRGKDLESGEFVAIKALRPELLIDFPGMVTRFEREGQALRQLNHPCIVKMVAAVQEAGQHFLVMEYIEGGSLQALLDSGGPLPAPRAVELALDLADAISRAHRLGIIHRDLKPANVLLAQDGTPRLTDFGLAHMAGSRPLTEAGMLLGTLDYLSPEACRGEALGEYSDIWAFGVLLFVMLTGQPPFSGETVAARLTAILTQPVPDLAELCPETPDALVDLVYRMLDKDLARRIPSVRLVGAELEALWKAQKPGSSTSLPQVPRFATPPQSGPARHNLPAQPTPFVGREAELAELDRLLDDPSARLVTILGMGGMGKTRLGLQAGANLLERFANGVYFVPLAALPSPEALVGAIGAALDFTFREGKPPRQQLLEYLANKHLLLILDNFEHLVEGAGLVPEILQAAPQVRALATSRERLNVQGEVLFHLSGMDFPEWETPADALNYSAVKLFMSSARRMRPDFELAAEDLKYIARICRLVQGLPLGIILAAAWVEMLSPAEVAEEIGSGLDFLASETRDIPERHRSLRAVFDYSWQMLNPAEQELFKKLAVFQGGFDRPVAQQVAGAGLRELMALNNKSLLHRTPAGRYEIHELLHQYAAEKLAATPDGGQAIRQQHSAYYGALLVRLASQVKGPLRHSAQEVFEAEDGNIRAAWEWLIHLQDLAGLAQAVEGVTSLYMLQNRFAEGQASMQMALAAVEGLESPEARRLVCNLLVRQAYFLTILAQNEPALHLLERSQAVLQEPALAGLDTRPEQALLLHQIGATCNLIDADRSRAALEQCIGLCQDLGDRWRASAVHLSLGWYLWANGEYPACRQHLEAGLELARTLGYQVGIATALRYLSYLTRAEGNIDEALHLAQESCNLFHEIGERYHYANGIETLAHALLWAGKLDEACQHMDESASLWEDLGDQISLANALSWSGLAHMYRGDYEQAQNLAETGLARCQLLGNAYLTAFARLVLGHINLVRGNAARAEELLLASVAIFQSTGAHYDEVSNLGSLALTAIALGQPERCQAYLKTALERALQVKASYAVATYIMPGYVRLLLFEAQRAAQRAAQDPSDTEAQVERAAEIYALGQQARLPSRSRWHADIVGRYIEAAQASLPPERLAAAQARGLARNLREAGTEMLDELQH